jgi:flagellar basal-body rod modification protein FlgD
MAALASGIFNHTMTAAQSLASTSPNPMSTSATDTADTSSSSTSDATISANDFLTLLVTEMQNQDPTATTDPNEYINQLVNVNSLEQLIDINQNLSSALGNPSAHVGSVDTVQATLASSTPDSAASASIPSVLSAAKQAPGNLTVPDVNPAAQTVASALGGKPQAHSAAGWPLTAR